jgi:hypothetical protein
MVVSVRREPLHLAPNRGASASAGGRFTQRRPDGFRVRHAPSSHDIEGGR